MCYYKKTYKINLIYFFFFYANFLKPYYHIPCGINIVRMQIITNVDRDLRRMIKIKLKNFKKCLKRTKNMIFLFKKKFRYTSILYEDDIINL